MFLLWLALTANVCYGQKMLIAAASDLKFALDSILTVYREANPGVEIQVTYGSSGKLYEQIRRGAPFEIFFSADLSYPTQLCEQKHCAGEVVKYGEGRLVVWVNRKDINIKDIAILTDPRLRKIAIANPLHAPYGKRAVEALTHYGLFDNVKSKLVYGENISQASQFVATNAADAGILALSHVVSPTMTRFNGNWLIVPREAHQRLDQGYVVLKSARHKSEILKFSTFFDGERSREILTYFGFLNTP